MTRPQKGWQVLSSDIVADYDVFRVRRTVARSPRVQKEFEFNVVDRPDCVLVMATTSDRRVILVEQFRHGIGEMSLEFPAGVLAPGEDPEAAALRELEEETGYRTSDAAVIADIFADPAINTNRVFLVMAQGCQVAGKVRLDEAEDVHTRLVSALEIDGMIKRGDIRHGLAIAAWYLYGQVKQ